MASSVVCPLAVAIVFVCIAWSYGAAIVDEIPYGDEPYIPQDLDGTNSTAELTAFEKWDKPVLYYAIANYPRGMSQDAIKSTIRTAFDSWSRVTNLDFEETVSSPDVDLQVGFGGMHHHRRGMPCRYNYENTLAHAFFPQVGDIHFNTLHFFNGETTIEQFLNTAVHEIGHALGLFHSSSRESIMYGSQIRGNLFVEPQPEDIQAIQAIYGVRSSAPSTTQRPPTTRPTPRTSRPRTKTQLCSLPSYDTILVDHRGNICVLKGQFYYNLNETNPPPRKLSAKWPALPQRVQAGLTYLDSKTYFYRGDQYWKYDKIRQAEGYPRPIAKNFPGIPTDGFDAILTVKAGGFLAFKGSQYWFYDTSRAISATRLPVDARYPRVTTSDFPGLPERITAALMTFEGRRFVFSGMRYYELDDMDRVVMRGGDLRRDWFNC